MAKYYSVNYPADPQAQITFGFRGIDGAATVDVPARNADFKGLPLRQGEDVTMAILDQLHGLQVPATSTVICRVEDDGTWLGWLVAGQT